MSAGRGSGLDALVAGDGAPQRRCARGPVPSEPTGVVMSARPSDREGRRGRNHGAGAGRDPSRARTPGPRGRPGSARPHGTGRRRQSVRTQRREGRRSHRHPREAGAGPPPPSWTPLEEVADGRAAEDHAVHDCAPKPEEGERAAADHCGDGEADHESTHHLGIPIPGGRAAATMRDVPVRRGSRRPRIAFSRLSAGASAAPPGGRSPSRRRGPARPRDACRPRSGALHARSAVECPPFRFEVRRARQAIGVRGGRAIQAAT